VEDIGFNPSLFSAFSTGLGQIARGGKCGRRKVPLRRARAASKGCPDAVPGALSRARAGRFRLFTRAQSVLNEAHASR
jgi:hypothetical protein